MPTKSLQISENCRQNSVKQVYSARLSVTKEDFPDNNCQRMVDVILNEACNLLRKKIMKRQGQRGSTRRNSEAQDGSSPALLPDELAMPTMPRAAILSKIVSKLLILCSTCSVN